MLLTLQIQIYQPIRSRNIDGFILPVHLFYDWVDNWDKNFLVAVDDLEKWLGWIFNDGLNGANVAVGIVYHAKPSHLVKIELISSQFWQYIEGEV